MNTSEKLHKYLHPKILFTLMLAPFMFICPLVLCSLTLGFPYPFVQNNATLRNYTTVFTRIFERSEDIEENGELYSKISTIKQRRGTCTLFAGQAFTTTLTQQEVSNMFLKNFSETAKEYQSNESIYSLIRNSEIKIVPIDINEPFSNTDVTLDLRTDFELSDNDIPEKIEIIEPTIEQPEAVEQTDNLEEHSDESSEEPVVQEEIEQPKQKVLYLAYLINTKAFDSLDYRCN